MAAQTNDLCDWTFIYVLLPLSLRENHKENSLIESVLHYCFSIFNSFSFHTQHHSNITTNITVSSLLNVFLSPLPTSQVSHRQAPARRGVKGHASSDLTAIIKDQPISLCLYNNTPILLCKLPSKWSHSLSHESRNTRSLRTRPLQ